MNLQKRGLIGKWEKSMNLTTKKLRHGCKHVFRLQIILSLRHVCLNQFLATTASWTL